ncbi:MAG: 5'-methylthioadenosine/S-adenosylhomocysteine nucleosidase [Actinobacteria bacterium]|nr:MAG: 5'-methylthioadenosine/S-adenosylhomocysteine nucleosidase [Actinomycetota bacterium]
MTPALTLPRPAVTVDAVIQCAMEVEAAPFAAAMEPCDGEKSLETLTYGAPDHHTQSFTYGFLEGSTVLLVTSGIGLANAASATARALALVTPRIVIAAGTTGGLDTDIEVGTIAAGVSALYHSADATAFGYSKGQIPQMPPSYHSSSTTVNRLQAAAAPEGRLGGHAVKTGDIVSGDSFILGNLVTPIRTQYPHAIATDMETAAIAQVCWSAATDWLSMRAVSDLCDPGAHDTFHMNSADAARYSYEAVRAFLSH